MAEQRPSEPPFFATQPYRLRAEITKARQVVLVERIQSRMSKEIGLTFDEPNILWASSFFEAGSAIAPDSTGVTHVRPLKVPTFAPEDTGRVLARWREGSLSLARLLAAYSEENFLLRGSLHSPDDFRLKVRSVVLKPYLTEHARQLGLERDPLTLAEVAKKREELMVEHVYHDSIDSHISVTERDLHRFYDQHVAHYLTYPVMHYAAIRTPTKRQADSLAALIRGGALPQDIMRADSLRTGQRVGRFMTMTQEVDEGREYYELLMEQLKPGQVTVQPFQKGGWCVLQSVAFDPGHQLSFAEARSVVEESVQNEAAEELLKRFLARHRQMLRVEAHPELVMRIDFRDPSRI
jgi:hypothetical protein